MFFSSLLSLFTSPLYVIALSMQMSVMPNITIYGDVSPKEINKGLLSEKIGIGNLINRKAIATSEKQLAKVAPNMPPAMVKGGVAKDLMKASGQVGLNKPFRAPVYRTYWECIRGLHKQGILGFYKGNGVRLAHHYFFSVAYIELLHQYSDDRSELFPKPSFTKSLVAAGAVAFGLHSLHLAEARLVLQNRLPSFQTYPSIMNMARE